jgi:hypothetical protein
MVEGVMIVMGYCLLVFDSAIFCCNSFAKFMFLEVKKHIHRQRETNKKKSENSQ